MEEQGNIIVTGTGRCGTTFLMNLFTRLEMGTNFAMKNIERIDSFSNGGLERKITSYGKAARITKSPAYMRMIPQLHETSPIEHIILPVRDIARCISSRKRNHMNKVSKGGYDKGIKTAREQMSKDTYDFYELIEKAALLDIPITTLHFDKFMSNPNYLFDKLEWLFKQYKVDRKKFLTHYKNTLDKKKIHF